MAGSNPSTGGDNEIEYIPFYGELNMTTFTTEDRKAATAKKPKKEKVTIVAQEATVEEPTTIEVVPPVTDEYVKPIEEYTPTDFALVNDPPEPGVADVAINPAGANVVRRGFTTIQMAHAYRNGLKNPEDFFIVEVREGMMMDGPILAHYVIRKGDEL